MRICALFIFVLFLLPFGSRAVTFPALTGKVVDNASILNTDTQTKIQQFVAGYHVVVVTVPDLQGLAIADYGYQLGRHWQIGDKDKNNGALFILAPNEREVRIEVGYGLEGVLTDALSSVILNGIIPDLKTGDYDKATLTAVQNIILVINGEPIAAADTRDPNFFPKVLFVIFIFLFFLLIFYSIGKNNKGGRGGFGGGSFHRQSRSSGGGFGGGYRGGGGSFGGGGASGKW